MIIPEILKTGQMVQMYNSVRQGAQEHHVDIKLLYFRALSFSKRQTICILYFHVICVFPHFLY